METLTALIARGGYNKNAISCTALNGIGEEWISSARWGKLPPADVDNVSTFLNGLCDGSCQVKLGAGGNRAINSICEDRDD